MRKVTKFGILLFFIAAILGSVYLFVLDRYEGKIFTYKKDLQVLYIENLEKAPNIVLGLREYLVNSTKQLKNMIEVKTLLDSIEYEEVAFEVLTEKYIKVEDLTLKVINYVYDNFSGVKEAEDLKDDIVAFLDNVKSIEGLREDYNKVKKSYESLKIWN
jgi:hypothetical protein